uniref:Uncharacterized protein n=1 Tax=Arundo donax TaxID=35708 RepID=A0A0A9CZW2_ARUDO
MEAEAEKERKMKKARVSPCDKKRKLEELYDAKLSDWLATARNGIGDSAGVSCNMGSLPKYDMGSDEALLPNIQNSNDDVVLLMPRKQTTAPSVMALKDNDMNPTLGDRGNFVVDKPPDLSNEPEGGGVTETLEEEILNISVDVSLDITDRPEEGTTVVMELQKEASGVSDRSEELTAPVIEEIEEEKVAIEGPICFRETCPSEKNIAIVMKAVEGIAVSEEAGRATEDAIEAAPQSQQEVDAGVMDISHDAVALPEEELPIQHTSNGGGCSDVPCIMEDNHVAGSSGTNDGDTTGCGFAVGKEREVPCVQGIGGEQNQMVEKDKDENPQEAPQIVTVECVQNTVPMVTDNDGEQTIVPPTVDDVATFNAVAPALLGVPEVENAQANKDFNLAKKDAEDMPMEVAEGKEAGQEQINTLAKGGAEEEHKEFSEVDHTDMTDPKIHSHFTIEKPEEAAEVECEETDGTTSLTARDTDGKLGDVSEVGHTEVENINGLIVNAGDENLAQVEPAEVVDMKGMMKEDTNNKPEDVPESENTGSEGTHGPVEDDTDGRSKEIHDVNAELENADGHEGNSDRPEGILQVDLLTRDETRWVAKEEIGDNTTEVPQVEYEKLKDETPIEEDTMEKPHADSLDLPQRCR